MNYAANVVVYTPVAEECLSGSCHEFRSPVGLELLGNAEASEHSAECSNEACGSICIIFYYGPIRVPIDGDEVLVTAVAEVVGTYCMEGVDWPNGEPSLFVDRQMALLRNSDIHSTGSSIVYMLIFDCLGN